MNKDILKKAVELVPDIATHDIDDQYTIFTQYGALNVAHDEPMFLDHVAAQLTRQANARMREIRDNRLFVSYGEAEPAITAIVESNVLSTGEKK